MTAREWPHVWLSEGFATYSNPLPHVLILTAIVVGVATLALTTAATDLAAVKSLLLRLSDAADGDPSDLQVLKRVLRERFPGPAPE